jgi:hypothetical protein
MNTYLLPLRTSATILIVAPLIMFGAYIATLVVPIVVREVVIEITKMIAGW